MYKKIFVIAFLVLFPALSYASTIYFEVSNSHPAIGDIVTVNVKLDTESKQINLVEGNINLNTFENNYEVKDVVYEDSVLTLWPNKPLFSKVGDVISFTGGQPGGFNSSNALLFRIVLTTKKTGEIVLIPKNINAYLNDGKGTQDAVTEKTLTIKINESRSFFNSKYVILLTILFSFVVLYLVVRFFLKNKQST